MTATRKEKRTEIEVAIHELEICRKRIYDETWSTPLDALNSDEKTKKQLNYAFIDGQINALEWLLGRNEKLYNVKD